MTDYAKMNCEQLEAVVAENEKKISLMKKALVQARQMRVLEMKIAGAPAIDIPQTEKLKRIRQVVCEEAGITEQSMMNGGRPDRINTPKSIAIFLSDKNTDCNQEEIGHFYGRVHSTVAHACNVARNRMQQEPKFKAMVERIEAKLKVNGEK
jgi:chromosomal replication initiation ATPase DnaA